MSFPTTVYISEEQALQTTSSQRLPLGTRGVTSDGRIFRYAQNGATALGQYILCRTMTERAFSTSTSQPFISPYAAGSTFVRIQLDVATASADYFKDGYLAVYTTDTAWNQLCPIDSNESLVSSTALDESNNGIWLKPPGLKKIADTDSGHAKLIPNAYKQVVISPAGNNAGFPLGITPCGVTAAYFFWLQTWGPTMAQAGEGISVSADKPAGMSLFLSTDTQAGGVAGAVATASGVSAGDTDAGYSLNRGRVGVLMSSAPAANYYHVIDLRLAP